MFKENNCLEGLDELIHRRVLGVADWSFTVHPLMFNRRVLCFFYLVWQNLNDFLHVLQCLVMRFLGMDLDFGKRLAGISN